MELAIQIKRKIKGKNIPWGGFLLIPESQQPQAEEQGLAAGLPCAGSQEQTEFPIPGKQQHTAAQPDSEGTPGYREHTPAFR